MNISMINSLVGMHALQQKIDTISNNLANMNTVGYKSREAYFSEILSSRFDQPEDFNQEGRLTPIGLDQGFGSKLGLLSSNFGQGQRQDTGITTDLMLEGKDIFFTVKPKGDDYFAENPLHYTRNGHFQLDASRYLVTDTGDFVLDADEEKIYIPEEATFEIDANGLITALYTDGEIEEIGALKIAKINTPQALESAGNNLYKVPEEFVGQGLNIVDQYFNLQEDQSGAYQVVQGALEASNTDLAKEMVQLNQAQRSYQFLAKELTISDRMQEIANGLIR